MSIKPSLLALAAALAASALPAHADMMFNRVATFAVADNLPADADSGTATSSEIISASDDGNTLVYSDSPYGGIGFIDITDPKAPRAGGSLKMDGEPTSVVIVGAKALVPVNTSDSKASPSGQLRAVDIAGRTIDASCELGGQPDSVAVSKDRAWLAIAIENERDEELNDGALPQMPAGNLKIVALKDGLPDCAAIRTIDLTGLAKIAPEDPEPEFVSFNDAGEIAVTLQENNHIAIVDAASGKVTSHFSAGSITLENVDTGKDGAISLTGTVRDAPREPDAVKWLDNERLAVANEGDWKGGTRGFTIFSRTGAVLYESGPVFEYEAVRAGHYPDKRNKKGIEPEGLEAATFGSDDLLFVAAERASVVGVYRTGDADPQFLQLLPSGIGPEGLVAIPQRNLLVTANETDLGEDGGARSHVMIYERSEAPAAYPMIVSSNDDAGLPIGWGALSGLAADPAKPGTLYAVSDSFYRNAPAIFTIDTGRTPALITKRIIVTRDGNPAQKLDLEGIATDGNGGFWLANEGDAAKLVPHALLHVDGKGEIKEEIGLPSELLASQTRFGLEGVTTVGEGDSLTLVMAVQREWKNDPKGEVKLLAYKPKTREWSAARYPLDKPEGGWMGLSEITAHDGKLYIVERDNLIGNRARTKKLYAVSLDNFKPVPLGGDLPVVEKTLARDLLPDLKTATNGYVVDKVEGFTIDSRGDAFVVTDNDGVDDSSGETLFLRLGNIATVN